MCRPQAGHAQAPSKGGPLRGIFRFIVLLWILFTGFAWFSGPTLLRSGGQPGETLAFAPSHELPVPPEIPLHKPYKDLTEAERETKHSLEETAHAELAGDIVVKKNGRSLKGRITAETPTALEFVRSFRGSGEMTILIPRSSIARIERAVAETPRIAYRDIRFQHEFPHLSLYRRPPFTIMTPKNYFEVATAVDELTELRQDFLRVFQPLLTEDEKADHIQLLFFSEERDFEAYRDANAPTLAYSSGFYSPSLRRLVIFDQSTSTYVADAEAELGDLRAQYDRDQRYRESRSAVAQWHNESKRKLQRLVNQETRRLLRHEGAHQLFDAYGVHSERGAEHLWLIEGLASYCENRVLGSQPIDAIAEIQDALNRGGLISIEKLVNYGDPTGFNGLARQAEVGTLYAQSALIVDYLMHPEHREAFFEYIRLVRDPANRARLHKSSRMKLLASTLGITPQELEAGVMAPFVRRY